MRKGRLRTVATGLGISTVVRHTHVGARRRGTDPEYIFGPHQLSDGSLRLMALTTLFLQPPEDLPDMIIVDEPELGLHPEAEALLAGMIRSVSMSSPRTTTVAPVTLRTGPWGKGWAGTGVEEELTEKVEWKGPDKTEQAASGPGLGPNRPAVGARR